ncbi:MAG: DUF1425 domain-containing protein [Tepidisphaeraceae bacterium]
MKRFATLTLVVSLAIAGCQSAGVDAPLRGRADVADGYGIFLSQTYDTQLRRNTAFGEEHVARDQYGLLSVSIPIRSAIDRTLYLEYQYSFFDEAGTQIEGPMGWLPVTLEAGSPGVIQFTSTSPKAAHYRVTVRFQR